MNYENFLEIAVFCLYGTFHTLGRTLALGANFRAAVERKKRYSLIMLDTRWEDIPLVVFADGVLECQLWFEMLKYQRKQVDPGSQLPFENWLFLFG